MRATLLLLGLLALAGEAQALPASQAPTMLRRRPAGWTIPAKITVPMRRFADSLLDKKLGTWREKLIDGKRVAARVEWHYWPEKGWHRGVTVYVRRGRKP